VRVFFKSALLLFLFSTLPAANAADCGYVFKCANGVCERAAGSECAATTSGGVTTVVTPSARPVGAASAVDTSSSSAVISRPPAVTAPPTTSSNPPGYGAPCAENGSCYGDISTVNGTPKTIHVDGYYRKDGTYVRGHYRSKGTR
jgi:hypothetical protein